MWSERKFRINLNPEWGEKQWKIGRGKQGEETQIIAADHPETKSVKTVSVESPAASSQDESEGEEQPPATQSQILNQARQLAKHPPSGMVGASSYNQKKPRWQHDEQLAGNLQAFPSGFSGSSSGQAPVVAEGEIHDSNLGGGNIVSQHIQGGTVQSHPQLSGNQNPNVRLNPIQLTIHLLRQLAIDL